MSARLLGRGSVLAAALVVAVAAGARAQSLEVRGFFDVGATVFAASNSFKAITGSSSGMVVGGGGGVVLPQRVFVNVHASRYKADGHRVFVADGQTFDLGIANTITITPLHLTGGYRFGGGPLIPYAGGGMSWYRYKETDPFAGAGDEVDERFTGYHVLGGAEYRINRWLGAAGEVQWTRVADALGQEIGSVAKEFGESDLGGTTFRVKVVVGR